MLQASLFRLRPLLLACVTLLLSAAVQLAAADPEIGISRGSAIADGGTDATGTASSALTAYDLTYLVVNSGSANLNLSNLSVGTGTNCTASILGQPAATVTPGGQSAFSIRVIPAATGAWTVPFSLQSNDANESPYDITITGTAQTLAAEIDVRTSTGISIPDGTGSVTVGGSAKGLAATQIITIANASAAGAATLAIDTPVVIQSASNCSALITAQPAQLVNGGQTTTFTAVVTPGQGAWSTVVLIRSNDSNEAEYTFTIRGTASGPEIAISRGAATISSGSSDTPSVTSVAGEQTSLTYAIANTSGGQLNIVRYSSDAEPGKLQLEAVKHWASEGSSVTLTVKRIDGNRGIVSVDWYTDSDSSIAEYDFPIQSGTVTWADGDIADKTFTVNTTEDVLPEGTERLLVRLHNAQGGATLIAPLDAAIAIEDEDAPNSSQTIGTVTYSVAERKVWVSETASVRMIEVARAGASASAPYIRLRATLSDGTATLNSDYSVYTGQTMLEAPFFDNGEVGNLNVVTWQSESEIRNVPGYPRIAYDLVNGIWERNDVYLVPPFQTSTIIAPYQLVWAGDNDNNWDGTDGGNDAAVYTNGVDYLIYIVGNGSALVPVNVLTDTESEPTESFHLTITEQRQVLLGTPTSSDHTYQDCTVFITDDDFSLQTTIISEEANCTAVVLAAPDRTVTGGSSTPLPLRVTPTGAGYWQFRATIRNDDTDEGGYTWLVTGNAQEDVPDIEVSRNSRVIPDATDDVAPGLASARPTVLTYLIRNDGTDPLILTSPATLANPVNCSFSGGSPLLTTIEPGRTTTMTVTVTPSTAGPWRADLVLVSDDPDEDQYNITIKGVATASPAPEFQWYRAGATLTPVATGATDVRSDLAMIQGRSYSLEYRIANLGAADLGLTTGSDAITIDDPSDFSVAPTAPTTAPPSATVAANGQTSVVFTFTPNAANWSFTYQLGNTDADEGAAAITISGTASAPAADAAVYREASLIPQDNDDAPSGLVATQLSTLTYSIANEGSVVLNLSAPTVISAAVNCTVSVVDEVDAAVAAGATTQLLIGVQPISAGPYSFTVEIPSDDPDENPVSWSVVAVAEEAPSARPEIQVRRSATDLTDGTTDVVGALAVGTPVQLDYTLDNLGNELLTIGTPSISGASNCAVRIVSAPASNVAPATGTALLLEVVPTLGGAAWSFSWSVATNDANENPTDITVVGTGIASPTPEVVVSRNGVNVADNSTDAIGQVFLNQETAATYTVANAGNAILSLDPATTIVSTVGCTVTLETNLPATLDSGSQAQLRLRVTPTASPWSFVVNIPNNDQGVNENPWNFTVSGTAIAAPADLAVVQGVDVIADGATLTVNPTTGSFSYTLNNVGQGPMDISAITFANLTGTPNAAISAFSIGGTTQVIPLTYPKTLPAGQSAIMTVTLPTPLPSAWAFSVSIANDGPAGESPYNWTVDAPNQSLLDLTRSGTAIVSDAAPGSVSLAGTLDAAADVVSGTGIGLATDLTYVVRNAGSAALSVTSASIVGTPSNCTVSITDALAASVASGATDNLGVRVTPGAGAAAGWSFLIRIQSDAADDPDFYLSVSSPIVASLTPEIAVVRGAQNIADGGSDSFGTVMAQTAVSQAYTITNQGLANLLIGTPVITVTSNCAAVLVTLPSATIGGGASSTLGVQVTPTAAGAWSFGISVPNNDDNENPMNWVVDGTAQPLTVSPGDLGLGGGGGGGCGAGGAMGLLALLGSLTLFRGRGRRRWPSDSGV